MPWAERAGPVSTSRTPRLAEEGSGLIGMVIGLGLTGLLLAHAGDGPDPVASYLGALALGMVATLPGALAMLGRRRPALFLAAGLIGVPISFISMGGATLPLLLPTGMAFVAYGRRAADSIPRVYPTIVALNAVLLGILSFAVMLVHEDPRCRSLENGITCSSDVVTAPEAMASLALAALAIASTWTLARPRPDEPEEAMPWPRPAAPERPGGTGR
ncbi:MAG: hypothetical protein WEB06_18775 [Actinomycetota bacterium]